MREFIEASPPCFALGLVEEQGQQCGFLALRPEEEMPPEIADSGFAFGHSLYGSSRFEVLHFAFQFYGFQTYNVLLNPNNPLVRTVLDIMVEGGDYFFFALSESGRVAAFRTEIGQETLSQVKANLLRLQQSTTTESQYELALCAFAESPEPEGVLLNWVCRDNIDYLDLSEDRMDLTPRCKRISSMIDNPASVERLMRKMEEQLPIPARATSLLVRFLRERGMKLPASRRVEIESVHYLGDEGGIACGLKRPESKEAIVVSLTHLRVEGGHPMAQAIRAYQIRRTAALAREQ